MYLKYNLIGSKIKVSLNLHENWHTSQFEDSEVKYDMIKGFLNSNPDLGKSSCSIQTMPDMKSYLLVNLPFA